MNMDEGFDVDFLDEFDETSCLGDEECAESLIETAPEGCLYCKLNDLEIEDD